MGHCLHQGITNLQGQQLKWTHEHRCDIAKNSFFAADIEKIQSYVQLHYSFKIPVEGNKLPCLKHTGFFLDESL